MVGERIGKVVCGAWMGVVVSAVAVVLVGCSNVESETAYQYPENVGRNRDAYIDKTPETIFGPGGLNFFDGDKPAQEPAVAIPVNGYLWRATLDTVSFMPLASADPFGGVIITDWFTPPESRGERFKMTVYILSHELRADGLKVAVFSQRRDVSGQWVDGSVNAGTERQLENAILTRAREMRITGFVQ